MSESARSTDELIAEFKRAKRRAESKPTAERHVDNLRLFREWLQDEKDTELLDAERKDVENHLLDLEERNYGNKTIGARYTAIQVFYKWCVAEGVTDAPPTENMEVGVDTEKTRKQQELLETVPPAVTPDEVRAMCDHVPDPEVRNKLIIKLMFQTGLREQELRNIRLRKLDREERSIRVRTAKSGDPRTVYYRDLEPEMTVWLDRGFRDSMRPADDSPYLFLTNRSEKLARDRPNRIIKQAAENAGVQEILYTDGNGGERRRITSHALRHGFARECVTSGMDISFLQELMGHEDIETTKIYLDYIKDDLKEKVREHGPKV